MQLRDSKVVIVGFGKSGQAAARHCAERGARVTVIDAQPADRFAAAARALAAWPIAYRFGAQEAPELCAADLVVASPGVPLQLPGLQAARAAGVPIVGEMELALAEAPRPVIAVTGTNGKSTTTTLISESLRASGIACATGGNLGTPLCDLLAEAARAAYWVIEVSSYQLEITPSLHAAIAVLLNITPDHLDRYADFPAYVAAKTRLLAPLTPADTLIFNAEDPIVAEAAAHCRAVQVAFAAETQWGDGRIRVAVPGRMAHEWDLAATRLVGRHNRENILAAGLAAAAAGARPTAVARVCREFPGLPHRCQFVREWRGIRFFDDSKGTNVGAVVKSVESFTDPVVLIAGGLDKGTGYAALQPVARVKVRCAVLMGRARELMREALAGCTETLIVDGMAAAVRLAADRARPGDVVLLSPACASFDMYDNYAERGEDFARCVRELQ
ncbi:MAG: UDP-N-acetylmuramoyl-L-alanine--D-glutamate ligase [Deltaproteobacteria bacterium]|nr:UDP-N-acetylmuramoyl-L-alanine--D-glutamate ligase [Deltaproteobacteria bacterium]